MWRIGILALSVVLLSAMANADDKKPIKVHIDATVNPWTHLNLYNDPKNFQFALVSDRTGGHREGIFEDGIAKINLLMPEFVMSVGDLIEGGTEDLAEIDREWAEFNSFVKRLKMPFFYVPGNHDISNEVMYAEWNKRFGRSYYHFVYHDVLFLCLNTEDPPRSRMSAEQAAYVKSALEQNKNVRWTLVFMHKPMWTYEEDTGWLAIEELLQGRQYTVFAGHTHEYRKYVRKDNRYIVLATTGGSTSLRGKNFGEFDEVGWVTMTDEGPILANLMLDGIWSEDVLTEENAELIRPALSGVAVRFDPVVIDTPMFKGAPARLRLTNDADVPMQAAVTLNATRALQPDVTSITRTVPPNSVEFVELNLTAPQPMPVDMVAPMKADWTLTYATENSNPVEVSGSYRLVLDAEYELNKVRGDIAIDGNLSEWGELPIAGIEPAYIDGGEQHWSGAGDASFRMGVRYDKSFVYVALEVNDDILRNEAGRKASSQDSVELWFDPRGDGQRNVAPTDKEGEQYWRIIVAPGAQPIAPEGVTTASATTTTGYTSEIAIPVSVFEATQPKNWSAFRLNVCIHDFDAEFSAAHNKVWWRHDWKSAQNVPYSGTFTKD